MRFFIPVLISALMGYFDGSGRTSPSLAYVYATSLILGSGVCVFGHTHYYMNLMNIGMVMRTTCGVMIYKKVLLFINIRPTSHSASVVMAVLHVRQREICS